MLLEAMVGVVLSAALGLGMAYSAARALNTQRYASTQNLAVMDMRLSLATGGACVAGTVPAASGTGLLANLSYERSCITLTPTISAAGASVATSLNRTESLSTSTSDTTTGFFGGDGRIRFGQ